MTDSSHSIIGTAAPEASAIIAAAALFLLTPLSFRHDTLYMSTEQVFELSAPHHREMIGQYRGLINMISIERSDLFLEGNVIGIPMDIVLRIQRLLEIRQLEKWNTMAFAALSLKYRKLAYALTKSTTLRQLFYITCLGDPSDELVDNRNLPVCISRMHDIITHIDYRSAPSSSVLYCRTPLKKIIACLVDEYNHRGLGSLKALFANDIIAVNRALSELDEILNKMKIWSDYNPYIPFEEQCDNCQSDRRLHELLLDTVRRWRFDTKQEPIEFAENRMSVPKLCCSSRMYGTPLPRPLPPPKIIPANNLANEMDITHNQPNPAIVQLEFDPSFIDDCCTLQSLADTYETGNEHKLFQSLEEKLTQRFHDTADVNELSDKKNTISLDNQSFVRHTVYSGSHESNLSQILENLSVDVSCFHQVEASIISKMNLPNEERRKTLKKINQVRFREEIDVTLISEHAPIQKRFHSETRIERLQDSLGITI